jgi:serine/threonine protein kinase
MTVHFFREVVPKHCRVLASKVGSEDNVIILSIALWFCLNFVSFLFRSEVQIGANELGRGEFGIVYQVEALEPKSCECPKCLLKKLYGAPEDRHKLQAEELNVNDEEKAGDNGQALLEKFSESSTTVHNNNCDHKRISRPPRHDGSNEVDNEQIVKWTDDVERSLNEMFSEEFQKEQEDDDAQDPDDDVSELSAEDGSLIRPNAHNTYDPLNTKSLRENFDTYRKCYMQRNCIRQGRPRYAVKRLRGDLHKGETKYNAAIDLAVEAQFLAVLKHPNIVRVRATVGRPGHDGFMIMMDCLNLTLREKIIEWDYDTKIRRNSTTNVLKRLFQIGNHHQPDDSSKMNPAMMDVHTEKLMAAYDLVRGMKFLHSNKYVPLRFDLSQVTLQKSHFLTCSYSTF